MSKILIYLEQRDGNIKKASLEAASKAVEIAAANNFETLGLVIGDEIANLDATKNLGLQKLVHLKNSELKNYSPSAHSKLISDYFVTNNFGTIFFANTSLGKDLAPRVAASIDAGIIMDCIELKYENNFIGTRPIYAGKALQDVVIESEKKVITLRPNIFKVVTKDETSNLETMEVANIDLSTRVIDIKKSEGKLDVAEADIIVSGGRGMKAPEHFELLEKLAEALGAAVGASRAVVDAGWRPHQEQVGQTGKTVSPSLYVACGISGAIQHMAGMSSSKYIVAINKDKDAPIFSIADYGITGDIFEILPAFIEEVKKIKS